MFPDFHWSDLWWALVLGALSLAWLAGVALLLFVKILKWSFISGVAQPPRRVNTDLLRRLQNHRAGMAPHQKERYAGKLLLEATIELERLSANVP